MELSFRFQYQMSIQVMASFTKCMFQVNNFFKKCSRPTTRLRPCASHMIMLLAIRVRRVTWFPGKGKKTCSAPPPDTPLTLVYATFFYFLCRLGNIRAVVLTRQVRLAVAFFIVCSVCQDITTFLHSKNGFWDYKDAFPAKKNTLNDWNQKNNSLSCVSQSRSPLTE